MKIEAPKSKMRTNLSGESFTVEMNPMIFDILINKGYANKVESVVREVSCNAQDAHLEVGNTNPFEVHLPNYSEPYFSVRDFGPGLSDEDMRNLYTRLGASGKRDSDTLTGCIGIGSKSPFAYVTTNSGNFTTKSFFNGVCRTYTCYIDKETNMPQIANVSESGTDERNGLEVSFAVPSYDFSKFAVAASKVFSYFENKPKITGHELEVADARDKYVHKYENNYLGGEQSVVVMGSVSYPIYMSNMRDNLDAADAELVSSIIDYGCLINADMGDVSFTPFREGLEYNKKTCHYIVKTIKNIAKEHVKGAIDRIENADTYLDACIALYEASKDKLTKNAIGKVFHDGKEVCSHIKHACQCFGNSTGWRTGRYVDNVKITSEIKIVVKDGKRGGITYCGALAREMRQSYGRPEHVVVYLESVDDLKVFGITTDHPIVTCMSKVPKNSGGGGKSYATTEVMELVGNSWKNTKINMDDGDFIYIPTYRLKAVRCTDLSLAAKSREIDNSKMAKVISTYKFDKPIYGVRGQAMKMAGKKKNWTNIWDILEKEAVRLDKIMQPLYNDAGCHIEIPKGLSVYRADLEKSRSTNPHIKAAQQVLKDAYAADDKYKSHPKREIWELIGNIKHGSQKTYRLDSLKPLFKEKPLLKHLYYNLTEKEVEDYLNA
jgi:hypothetical protein